MDDQPNARRPSGGGRLEKLIFFLALVGLLAWGFSGSWDFPEAASAEPVLAAAPRQGDDASQHAADFSPELASRGEELFQANGCYACHSVDGSKKIGPSLLGIYGEEVALSDGSSTVIDDDYLLESILSPQADLVAGFEEAAMPNYEGLVSESDAQALSEYIKSLN